MMPQGSVRVWSLKSASLLTNLPPGRVRGLGFSKREDVLVAVSAPGLVSIWDASTWTTRCSFAETNYATTPAFSPDGRLFVACSGDNTVHVIPTETVEQPTLDPNPRRRPSEAAREILATSLYPSSPEGSTPDAVAVAPDGKTLYVANADNNDVMVVDITHPGDSRIAGFVPVGSTASPFAGVLDGQGHAINGLSINQPTSSNVGLIGVSSSNAAIKRLGLTNGNVSGNVNVGGLAGYLNGSTIIDSFFSGNVVSTGNSAGGLVGANSGLISNSYAAGSVTSRASGIGGLVGSNNSSISNCYATNAVSGGTSNVGGLAGGNFQNATINQSYSTGKVTSTGSSAGAFLGGNAGAVTGSYWNATSAGQTKGIGSGTTTGAAGATADVGTTVTILMRGIFDRSNASSASSHPPRKSPKSRTARRLTAPPPATKTRPVTPSTAAPAESTAVGT